MVSFSSNIILSWRFYNRGGAEPILRKNAASFISSCLRLGATVTLIIHSCSLKLRMYIYWWDASWYYLGDSWFNFFVMYVMIDHWYDLDLGLDFLLSIFIFAKSIDRYPLDLGHREYPPPLLPVHGHADCVLHERDQYRRYQWPRGESCDRYIVHHSQYDTGRSFFVSYFCFMCSTVNHFERWSLLMICLERLTFSCDPATVLSLPGSTTRKPLQCPTSPNWSTFACRLELTDVSSLVYLGLLNVI